MTTFSKQVTLDKIEIFIDGVIQVRTRTTVLEDAVELASQFSRHMYVPGDDTSAMPPRLAAICAAVWTPAVIAAYRAAHP